MSRRAGAAAVLALALVPAALAGDAPAETTLGSVFALVQRSFDEARAWSPGARLYSITGKGPKTGVLWEEWTLAYGDPERGDGFISMKFANGAILERHVSKGGRAVHEYYWEGKLRNRSESNPPGYSGRYDQNLPLGAKFIDAPALHAIIKAQRFAAPSDGQYTLELFRVPDFGKETRVSNFTLDGSYRQIGDCPPNSAGKVVWGIDNLEKAVFLEATKGTFLNRRPSTSKAPPGPEAWEIRR